MKKAPGFRCGQVRLNSGRLAILVPRSRSRAPALRVVLGSESVSVVSGEAYARLAGVRGVCVASGTARLARATPPASPPAKKASATALTRGRCIWFGQTTSRSQYPARALAKDRGATKPRYDFATPTSPLPIDLAQEVATLASKALGGAQGGSDVEGGSQSMCLETGAEGEGLGADGGSQIDVTKPPPPAQLRLRIRLLRR